MPIEFVLRIEVDNNAALWKALYTLIREALKDLPYFNSIHDYGDYICEQFELSPNEMREIDLDKYVISWPGWAGDGESLTITGAKNLMKIAGILQENGYDPETYKLKKHLKENRNSSSND